MERSEFLARVRERLGGSEVPPLPGLRTVTPASGDGRGFDRFAEELSKLSSEARRLRPGEIADHVAELGEGARTAVVAEGVGGYRAAVEEGLARAACAILPLTRETAASADLGVTGADFGVASTGSVLVRMGPEAPRVASLLPPLHLVILPEERLLPGFEELFAAWPERARHAAQTVLITGPSRTADIELSIVRGVHGPERLAVIVVSSTEG